MLGIVEPTRAALRTIDSPGDFEERSEVQRVASVPLGPYVEVFAERERRRGRLAGCEASAVKRVVNCRGDDRSAKQFKVDLSADHVHLLIRSAGWKLYLISSFTALWRFCSRSAVRVAGAFAGCCDLCIQTLGRGPTWPLHGRRLEPAATNTCSASAIMRRRLWGIALLGAACFVARTGESLVACLQYLSESGVALRGLELIDVLLACLQRCHFPA